jgi:hypothetical protein
MNSTKKQRGFSFYLAVAVAGIIALLLVMNAIALGLLYHENQRKKGEKMRKWKTTASPVTSSPGDTARNR